ncbi:hypothetical protein NBRGN_045_01160 [Nocardia brasiliensis NBRC 14402]|uniref:hypothetical protein n=1 Tax=Nocardia brasiliensis TaxID=37326 RepID=UPI0002EFB72F|nr:hypothetical protein [Nocardia brasiliensis]ASF09901.1 hypothetical protein CEQ30_23915 [Nocardia brasiliensis]MBF6125374.1 hypothetical protein [Nocardia brasiliensis]MBF6544954.1 hypothetical protein [Nocardia brasiliensis]SUB55012.1 Uncharacterised protein [Nocardia brasiliensis]GAJ82013.1 hypothetical protein NBRGN_045_01160 [Nocardia brasiliensis NBRC 14402]
MPLLTPDPVRSDAAAAGPAPDPAPFAPVPAPRGRALGIRRTWHGFGVSVLALVITAGVVALCLALPAQAPLVVAVLGILTLTPPATLAVTVCRHRRPGA